MAIALGALGALAAAVFTRRPPAPEAAPAGPTSHRVPSREISAADGADDKPVSRK